MVTQYVVQTLNSYMKNLTCKERRYVSYEEVNFGKRFFRQLFATLGTAAFAYALTDPD